MPGMGKSGKFRRALRNFKVTLESSVERVVDSDSRLWASWISSVGWEVGSG